jgi:MFS family permease
MNPGPLTGSTNLSGRIALTTRNTDTMAPDRGASTSMPSTELETQPLLADAPVWKKSDTLKLISACFSFLSYGIAANAVGVLLPRMEDFYHTSHGTTAFIFSAHTLGYLLSTTILNHIHNSLGRRGVATLSPVIRLVATIAIGTGLKAFPVALGSFIVMGFGAGFIDVGYSSWASGLPYASVCLGFLNGSYSVGSILGPILAAGIIKVGWPWYGFYWIWVSLSDFRLRTPLADDGRLDFRCRLHWYRSRQPTSLMSNLLTSCAIDGLACVGSPRFKLCISQ